MSVEEISKIEFTYEAVFSFDSLPNNSKQGHDSSEIVEKLGQPKWHLTAKAPVPFNEEIFWMVMERWIFEAPSIIPPVSKVEIINDLKVISGDERQHQEGQEQNGTGISARSILTESSFNLQREELLLESMKPSRIVQRKLLPKRANKDPIMEELLYFVKSSDSDYGSTQFNSRSSSSTSHSPINVGDKEDNRNDDDCSGIANKCFAVFSPFIDPQSTEERQVSEMELLRTKLPFYYPKVRGFRYGYMTDREEDEDLDHNCSHDEGNMDQLKDDSHFEYHPDGDDDDDEDVNSRQEETTKSKSKSKPKAKKTNPKSTVPSKRKGWITLDLFLAGDEGEFTDKMQYAFKELFKKLYKWGVNSTKGFTKSRVRHDVMVPKDLYLSTYARLKTTYAQKWVQSWPEKTDPRKFVFEDIAIASWLVALWELERKSHEQEQEKKQTFVDLGCGNGLLTHILNEEGHHGTGIDITSRKVWDVYGPSTNLEAKTIIPNETTFDDVDWIIGNHADELAPWIPIIAMRSKPLTRFVVIPCCFFDLNGSRYQFPRGAPEGKYKAYQEYICSVIDNCGYSLDTEVLRIPSTKNIALVGKTKTKSERDGSGENEKMYEEKVNRLIQSSGEFVARISDKEKQVLRNLKQMAKLQSRGTELDPLPHKNEINSS